MLRDGRIVALPPKPDMRRDPLMLVEYFHCRLSCSNVDIFSQVFERNGVEFALTENVTVHLDLGFPPLCQFVGGFGKREQELFFFGEEGCSAALALPGQGGGVDMFQSSAYVLLQILEGENLNIAESGDNFSGRNQDGVLHGRFIPGFADARGQYDRSVIGRHLLIRLVQIGLVEIGPLDAAFEIVRNKRLGDTAEILEGVDMTGDPGRQLFVAERFDVDDPATRQNGDEQRRLRHLPALGVEERDPCAGPVHLQRERGFVLQTDGCLVHLGVQVIVPAELRLHVKAFVALTALFDVLLPEQLEGDVRLRQFSMHIVEVGHLEGRVAGRRRDLRQTLSNGGVVHCVQILQGEPTLIPRLSQIQRHRVSGHPVRGGDLALAQAAVNGPNYGEKI